MEEMLDVDEHHWWYRGRRAIIARELARMTLPDVAHVLDAGCGSGRNLLELAHLGAVSGVELNEDAASLAASRGDFDVQIARLEALPFEDGRFDLVTCLDVVEHIEDDVAALRELRRVARPGAQLLLTVPAYQALWSQHDVANHHHRRYSRRTLTGATRAAGWQLERLTSFNALLLAPAAVFRLAERRRPVDDDYRTDLQVGRSRFGRLLELPMRLEARWLGAGRTLPVGLSLLAIARNPVVGVRARQPVGAAAARD